MNENSIPDELKESITQDSAAYIRTNPTSEQITAYAAGIMTVLVSCGFDAEESFLFSYDELATGMQFSKLARS